MVLVKGGKFNKFIVMDKDGKEHEVTRANWEKCSLWKNKDDIYQLMRTFVQNEIAQKPPKDFPKHIEYMKKLELVDYCPESDVGNMKWYPNGSLIFDLIKDYALLNLALPWGAFKMQNPLLYRTSIAEIGKLMGEFHERDYWAMSGKEKFVLRFASDPGGFPFMQKITFSHKQMPMKVYEEATCFRREQKGEVVGLRRVRNFHMTDMHAFCANDKSGEKEFVVLSNLFAELMDEVLGKKQWVLGWEGTEDFYKENKSWLKEIGKRLKIPAFFKLMKKRSHYYDFKNEYQVIGADGANVQVSTVQWDTINGKRFGISYVDASGKKVPVPIIIHASSFGSIERTLYGILENAARAEERGKPPMLPLWLSPIQVRICPVSDAFLDFSDKLSEELEKENIRVDIDDKVESVGYKVREAESYWIPYILVIGEKEKKSKKLQVRVRKTGKVVEMSMKKLVDEIKKETKDTPFRPIYVPKYLSKRPIFVG